MKKLTTEQFIRLANVTHHDKYDYSKSIYINSRKPITVTCPIHGDFIQKANNHLTGAGCTGCKTDIIRNSIKLTQNEFIEKVKKKYNNKYIYIDTIYTRTVDMVDIICPIHGKFSIKADSHLNGGGCKKCGYILTGLKLKLSTDEFIIKANVIHNFKYDYSKVIYSSFKEKVKIICKDHGEFLQAPAAHFNSCGCPKCKIDNIGWTLTKWKENGEKSNHFESFKLYILECFNENERFYKIGRTFVKLGNRFSGKIAMPYKYNIITIIDGDAENIFRLEHDLKIYNKENKYIPNIYFPGINECFIKLNLYEYKKLDYYKK